MAWGRQDDKHHSHRKTIAIPRRNRCEAIGLFWLVNSWCNDHQTDGRVPRDIWDEFGTSLEIAMILVEVGYWEETESGFQIVNFAEFNPTKAENDVKREAERVRKASWRASKAERKSSSDGSPVDVPLGQAGQSHGSPEMSQDVPESSALTQSHTHKEELLRSSLSSEIPPKSNPRPDVEELCQRLASRMVENGSKAPTVSERWRTEARLLLDRDERPLENALRLIDWATADSFWKANILSMPKFREKYDQLRLKANEELAARRSGPMSASEKVAGWGAIAAQMASETNQTQIGA